VAALTRPGWRPRPLLGYVLRRLGVGVLLGAAVSVLIFAGLQLLPGNAASAILGRQSANPLALHRLEVQFGLDHPALQQYLTWTGHLLRGNLGISYAAQEPVTTLLAGAFGNTLILAGATLVLMIPLAVALGTYAGVRAGRRSDAAVSGLTLGAIALPEFVTGTVLAILFAVTWKVLPAVSLVGPGTSPLASPQILVLPVATLLISSTAYTVRMIRAGVADVMASDYVEAARLNGIPEGRIIRRHVLRNALVPAIQTFAMTTQYLVGGVVVVETVFQYPGIGVAMVQAVSAQDIPVVLALGLLIALLYIALNIAADVAVVLLIPRLRTEAG
jgi:peptide/nickel transport system permease protein